MELADSVRHVSIGDALAEEVIDGFVLGAGSLEQVKAAIGRILGHPFHCLVPIFTSEEVFPTLASLTEGVAREWGEVQKRVAATKPQLTLLGSLPKEMDYEEKMLRWLFVRPEGLLQPVFRLESPTVYTYPLLEVLHPDSSQVRSWITSLVHRGMLAERELVDRIRLCPGCGKGHLNFLDRCPNCQGIDIHQHDFLHCFACGHVAPDTDFTKGNGLTCPKCRAQLRHIGADYDRPLENHRCRSCGNVFSEPEVVARCFDCGRVSHTDQLESVNVMKLGITEEGRIAVRNGTLRDVYAVFDNERFASRRHFEQSLDWIRDIYNRYGSPAYSLLHFTVRNVAELVDSIGRPATVVLLEEFSRRLRAIMRDTDIPVRLEQHRIVLLMPATTKANTVLAIKRIAGMAGQGHVAGREELQVEYGAFSVPENDIGKESAAVVLAKLVQVVEGKL